MNRATIVGTLTTLIILTATVSAVDAAQVEHTPIPQDPKPNFTSMQFLVGSWDCQVASSRRPRPFAQHATTTFSPDGYWMVTRTVTDKVPWNPITITNTEYVTYDTTTQRWIDMGMDDYGAYDVSASPGWSGDGMTWTEIAYPRLHGAATNDPRVFRKLSDTQTESDTSFTEGSGQRVSINTMCTKRS